MCHAVHALLLDDIGTKVPLTRLGNFTLSWLLETSPNNYQGGIIFNGSLSVAEAESLNKALIENNLCDPGSRSPATRWARLPVGINGKAKYRDEVGTPFQCRLVEWNPQRCYLPKEILDGLKIAPLPTVAPKTTNYVGARRFRVSDSKRAQDELANAPEGKRRDVLTKWCFWGAELILAQMSTLDSVVGMFAKAGERNGINRRDIEGLMDWTLKIKKKEQEAFKPRDELALAYAFLEEMGLS